MKLPKLNRKQRIGRNLLLAALVLFSVWAALEFAPPNDTLAAKWRAESYGLPEPEILMIHERESSRHDVILRWEDGRLASMCTYRKLFFFRRAGSLWLTEPADGVALIMESGSALRPEAVFLWADAPGAVRAECDLRLQAQIYTSAVEDDDDTSRKEYFDWDETYVIEAEPNENGVYRFPLEPKYDRAGGASIAASKEQAEESAFRELEYALERRGRETEGFEVNCTVTFYDAAGSAVKTWQCVVD